MEPLIKEENWSSNKKVYVNFHGLQPVPVNHNLHELNRVILRPNPKQHKLAPTSL